MLNSEYNRTRQGQTVQICSGGTRAILLKGWWAPAWFPEKNFDGMIGEIDFEFGEGTSDHHIAVNLEGEEYSVGFPPEYVQIWTSLTN